MGTAVLVCGFSSHVTEELEVCGRTKKRNMEIVQCVAIKMLLLRDIIPQTEFVLHTTCQTTDHKMMTVTWERWSQHSSRWSWARCFFCTVQESMLYCTYAITTSCEIFVWSLLYERWEICEFDSPLNVMCGFDWLLIPGIQSDLSNLRFLFVDSYFWEYGSVLGAPCPPMYLQGKAKVLSMDQSSKYYRHQIHYS